MATPPIKLILANDKTQGRITVDLEPFLKFDITITQDLKTLTDRWSDKSPKSKKPSWR